MVLLGAIVIDVVIISTNVGGAKEIIKDSQWLFNVGDENKLAALMLDMYALDDMIKKTVIEKNKAILDQNFTDEAVKNAFWQ